MTFTIMQMLLSKAIYSGYKHFLSVRVFLFWKPTFCTAKAMLYH